MNLKSCMQETTAEDKVYLKDTQIDTDFELLFPDDYINSITERLLIYKQLNEVKDEAELKEFENMLLDRFGALPLQAVDLLDSMRVKWIGTSIGLEKIIMKQQKFVGYFISDQQSQFYNSPAFAKIVQYIQDNPGKVKMKEKKTRNGLRLLLTFERNTSIQRTLEILNPLAMLIEKKSETLAD